MKNTKKQTNEMQVTNVVTNEFTPMYASIIIKQGANVLQRIIEQKKYNDEFSDLVASKFDLFKEAFNGKNKIFDVSNGLPITFEMHIEHSVYNDIIKGEIETSDAKKICMLLNSEFCKTFVGAPAYNVVKLERTKYNDRKNRMAMAKDKRHEFKGTYNTLESAMLYPIAQLN